MRKSPSLLGALLVGLALSPAAAAQYDAYVWTLVGCSSVQGDQLQLEVCVDGCPFDLSWATMIAPETGTYTTDIGWDVDLTCCVSLTLSRSEPMGIIYSFGDSGLMPWCDPGTSACSGELRRLSFHLEAGQELTFMLSGQELGCGSLPNAANVVFENLRYQPGLQPPEIHAVETGTPAYAETGVRLEGELFEPPLVVDVDGQPVPVTSMHPGWLILEPPPGAPGFHDVTVTTPAGDVTLKAAVHYWPTLTAALEDGGDAVRLELVVQDLIDHHYWLVVGLAVNPSPIPLAPEIYHGLWIDLTQPWLLLSEGVPAFGEPEVVIFDVPGGAALSGMTLRFQGLATTAFEHTGHTYELSFTNPARVLLP